MIWSTVRTARRPRRADCGHFIERGGRYRSAVASPHHDDLGNVGWWRLSECAACAAFFDRPVDQLPEVTG